MTDVDLRTVSADALGSEKKEVVNTSRSPGWSAEKALAYGGYVALVSLYYLASQWVDLDPTPQIAASWRGALLLTASLGTGYVLAISLKTLFERPRTTVELFRELKCRLWRPATAERLGGIFVLGGGVMVMFDAFARFKPAIPTFGPYRWDGALADLDLLLHLGRDPWRWLHALPARDVLTAFFDWTYVQWYNVMVGTLAIVLVAVPLRARLHFFYGFVALWMLGGTVAGTAFASGGPVYFGHITGDTSRFGELFSYLDGAAPIARGLQDRLWQAFVTPGGDFPFEGISAMPSLHVAVAAYILCWGWTAGRTAKVIFALYAVTIFLGSVHLGWHYAVDGYVGALIAWMCWWTAARAAGRGAKVPGQNEGMG